MIKRLCLCIGLLLGGLGLWADEVIATKGLPRLGAQVFIEPGQTEEETEQWFRMMRDHGMTICRIRMFECYMRTPQGGWDFSLFDRAFRLAEKYGIRVMGTFFPMTEKTDIGGWKFPKDESQLQAFAEYIRAVTTHFRRHASLYAWVLINEPGDGFRDEHTPFIDAQRDRWMAKHPLPDFADNGYPLLVNMQEPAFRNDLTTEMLRWIAKEVRKYDPAVPLHVNNHNLFFNLGEYHFPAWREFLTHLGGSAHASWHFSLFPRNEYALAMSANSEILSAGAGELPWLMTELQGGNNTYSGEVPLCPTSEEITQWLWTIVGTGGKGAIFWTLNGRSSGIEAGEWALLNYRHRPTERLQAVAAVSDCLKQHAPVWKEACKRDAGVYLVYLREALWGEQVIATPERRYTMKNMLGYFKALSESGVTPNVCAMDEFDFTRTDYSGKCMLLAHQTVIPQREVAQLEHFVRCGGTLLVDGLSGYYNELLQCTPLTGFYLAPLLGGQVNEWLHQDGFFTLPPVHGRPAAEAGGLPAFGWKGVLEPETGSEVICGEGTSVYGLRHALGKGQVYWLPALLGVPARKDGKALAAWLRQVLPEPVYDCSFRTYQPGVLMKVLHTPQAMVGILVNQSDRTTCVGLQWPTSVAKAETWFAGQGGQVTEEGVLIHPQETVVWYQEKENKMEIKQQHRKK